MRRAAANDGGGSRCLPAKLTTRIRRRWRQTAAIALSTWSALAGADIYRYQDERGGWHFTDAPPAGVEADRIPDIRETSRLGASEPIVDLGAQLEGAYDPITPIARATLAVVTVKSAVGEASGFFCSHDGHILTNRHVVRPSETGELAKRDQALEGEDTVFQMAKERLQVARDQIALMEKDLAGYQRVLERANDDSTRQWAQDAHDRLFQRWQLEQKKVKALSADLRAISKDLEKSRRDLDGGRRSAALATSFDVVLKDGTELMAELVATGTDRDLALLKIDGVVTPRLQLGETPTLSQGERVYAIGNPLGMQDAVTSGVITRIADEHIYTDAQILPGSSGGPLITESGVLIGINVAKNVASGESPYTTGFGKSIPVQAVLDAFRDALPTQRDDQVTTNEIGTSPPRVVPDGGATWD